MGLRQNFLDEPISELDWRPVVAVLPSMTVREATALMRRKKVGCVVVTDDQSKPVGQFTERMLMRLLHTMPQALDHPVTQHMELHVDCLHQLEPIARLLSLMQRKATRYVVVVDDQGKAIALTGQKGMMAYMAEHFPRQVKVQEMGANKPYMEQREGA